MAKKALCIGINTYGGANDLYGCVNDARDWAAFLCAQGYEALTLTDTLATGANIRASIRHLLQEAHHRDRLVIHYSGHGSYVPDANGDEPDGVDECWLAADINATPDAIITDDELVTLLKVRASGVRVAVISDSCHSGTMTRFGMAASRPEVRRIRFMHPGTFLPPKEFARLQTGRAYARVSQPYPAVLLAGCQDDEYSYDAWFGCPEDGSLRANGAFTRVALDTFRAGMSYRAWSNAIKRQLPSPDYPQEPNLRAGFWQKFWQALA
jgi:hypothetical protein